MKSWTRTLNLDDAHTLLAMAEVGRSQAEWIADCDEALPEMSPSRRRELVRLLRDGFLEWTDDERIAPGLFLEAYSEAPASAQIEIVQSQWALSHPLTLVASDEIVAPALDSGDLDIPLAAVDALVARHLDTSSSESLRKTRTVVLNAMEGMGTIIARGTGKNRALRASRGTPHPIAFAYLVRRELADRGTDSMMRVEVVESSVATRITRCGTAHASTCLRWCLDQGVLQDDGDAVSV